MAYRSIPPTPVVLVSCLDSQDSGKPNLITVAWTGTVNSHPPTVSISVRPSRFSHGMISRSGEFVINLVSRDLCRAADYCGVRSGKDTDKARNLGLSYRKALGMRFAPALEGAPVSLNCQVRQRIPLGSHDLFLGEITAVEVREDLIDGQGAIHLEKADLTAYSHGLYHALGPVLGFFGYSLAGPDTLSRRIRAAGSGAYELRSARFLAADLLRSVLTEGDRAIDATMGNGHDTAMLCSLVGEAGHVDAFDPQEAAVAATRERLTREGLLKRAALYQTGHEHMSETVAQPVRAAVFNLGWLPGGDHRVTTRVETTMSAVRQALRLLLPGGVLVICAYPGHEEGRREKEALEQWMAALPTRQYNVLSQCFPNAGENAPCCYTIQRQRAKAEG